MLVRTGTYTVYYRHMQEGPLGYLEYSIDISQCRNFTHAEQVFNEQFKNKDVSIHKIVAKLSEL